jgi:hypothetical protein
MRSGFETIIRYSGLAAMLLCGGGAIAGMVVVLIRIPALAQSKLELLSGTLQGVAVSLLFAIAALLINLTLMIRGATKRAADLPWSGRTES